MWGLLAAWSSVALAAGRTDDVIATGAGALIGELVGALVAVPAASTADAAPEPIGYGGTALGGVAGATVVALTRRTGTVDRTALGAAIPAVAGTVLTGLAVALREDLAPNAPEAHLGTLVGAGVLLVVGIPVGAGLGTWSAHDGTGGGGRAPWMVSAGPSGLRVAGRF